MDDFEIVNGLLYLRGSSGYHRLDWYGCNSSARKACVTCYVRTYIVLCRRVRQWLNQYFRVWRVYAPYVGTVRVRISTKSSIVWKPSWITSSRWRSHILRRSYFITSISPRPLRLADQFSVIDRLGVYRTSAEVMPRGAAASQSFE